MIDEPIKTTDRRRPLLDIGIVFVASAIAFMAESSVADHLPWGAEARGVVAVLVGTAIAIWLTYRHGGNLSSLGSTRPKSWVTAPLWAFGILVTFIAAQGLVRLHRLVLGRRSERTPQDGSGQGVEAPVRGI